MDRFLQPSSIAIFPEYKLIVNRIKKSGNTSLVTHLDELAGKKGGSEIRKIKRARALRSCSFGDIADLAEYKTLIVVRNPFSRCISGYRNKIEPGRSKIYSGFPGYGQPLSCGFYDFLKYLKGNNFGANLHFFPQSDLMFQPLGKFTYTAKLETLFQDLIPLFEDLGIGEKDAEKFRHPHALERAQKDKITRSSELKEAVSPECAELVAELYSEDFSNFGYSQHLAR